MKRFSSESLLEITQHLREGLAVGPVYFEALNPDVSRVHYSGETLTVDGQAAVYRSLHDWCELAEGLQARLQTPVALSDSWLRLCMHPLTSDTSWTNAALPSGSTEKYGISSTYARTSKLETPSFLVSYLEALDIVDGPRRSRVLSVGVNRGDELGLVAALGGAPRDPGALVGLDHCSSAIQLARQHHPDPVFHFVEGDAECIDTLGLGSFDLLISINTLHSPSIDGPRVFRQLLRDHLRPGGAVVLGIPNSRYIDHALMYGAPMRNFQTHDLSVLWKKVAFYRRYLNQHGFRVRLLGKHTVLVVGW